MAHENFLSAIWDTSHWNSWSNLDSRYFDMCPMTSYGHCVLWPLLKYVDFWWLQCGLSIFPKMGPFRKSVFLMKKWKLPPPPFQFSLRRPGIWAIPRANFFRGAAHWRGHCGPSNWLVWVLVHLWWVEGYLAFMYLIKNQFIGLPRVVYMYCFGFLNMSPIWCFRMTGIWNFQP